MIPLVEAYIQKNYREPEKVTLGSLAKEFNLSRWTVSKQWNKAMPVQIPDYILNLRIADLMHKLLHSDRPVMELASECGFHSKAHLYRVFVSRVGVCPDMFRRKQ